MLEQQNIGNKKSLKKGGSTLENIVETKRIKTLEERKQGKEPSESDDVKFRTFNYEEFKVLN
jgi:hypothetical protein